VKDLNPRSSHSKDRQTEILEKKKKTVINKGERDRMRGVHPTSRCARWEKELKETVEKGPDDWRGLKPGKGRFEGNKSNEKGRFQHSTE